MVTFLCLFSCVYSARRASVTFTLDLEDRNVREEDAETNCEVRMFNYRRSYGLGPDAQTWYSGIEHDFQATLDVDFADWIFLRTSCEDAAWIDKIKYSYDTGFWDVGVKREWLGRDGHLGWCLSSNKDAHMRTSFQDRIDGRCYKIFAISPLQRADEGGSVSTVWGFDNDADWWAYDFPLHPYGVPTYTWGRRSLEEQGAELLGTIEAEMFEPTTQEPLGTIENEMFEHIIPLTASDDAIMPLGAVKALMELEICEAKKEEDCELKLNKVIEMATSEGEPIPMGSNDVLENAPLDVDLTNDVREGRRKL